jgi:hydroxymethylglutaryl-CoA lyase
MNLNSNINIHEIGPRDGFQNVKEFIPTERKMEIIEGLIAAGFDTMQLGSFVSPKAIPQMRDAGEIVQRGVGVRPQISRISGQSLSTFLFQALRGTCSLGVRL